MRTATRWAVVLLLATVTPLQAQLGTTSSDTGNVPTLEDLLATPVTAASRYEQSAREAPASVTVITAEEIEEMGYETLAEALSSQPGFFQNYDRNYHYAGTRGFQRPGDYNNRILQLIDGHILNDAVGDAASVGFEFPLAMEAIERIEIARGPGSSMYGGNAMLAVVNVVTKGASELGGGQVAASAGSLGLRRVVFSIGKELSRNAGFVFTAEISDEDGEDLYFPDLDDPETNLGRTSGMDWLERRSVHARATLGSTALAAGYSLQDKGIPTAPWETLLDEPSWTKDSYRFVQVDHGQPFSDDFRVDLAGALTSYEYSGGYAYEAPGGLYLDAQDSHLGTASATAQWDPGSDTRVVMGADARHETRAFITSGDDEGPYGTLNNPSDRAGLFAQVENQLARELGITVGVRYDRHSAGFAGVSPRVAAVYHPSSSQTFKLLYGRAFRAPSLWERDALDDAYRGNPDLIEETIRTAEIWWEGRLGRGLWAQATLYQYWLEGLIDETYDEADGLAFFDNLSEVGARGIELRLNGESGSRLSWYLSTALQRARSRAEGPGSPWATLVNSPMGMTRAGITFRLPDHAYVSGAMSHESGRTTVNGDETDSFFLFDAKLGAPKLLGALGVSVTAKNLLDNEVFMPGGWEHAQWAIPQRGRQVRVALTWGF